MSPKMEKTNISQMDFLNISQEGQSEHHSKRHNPNATQNMYNQNGQLEIDNLNFPYPGHPGLNYVYCPHSLNYTISLLY